MSDEDKLDMMGILLMTTAVLTVLSIIVTQELM